MTDQKKEQTNAKKYLEMVRTFDPELFLTKQALLETGVNPLLLPRIIRAIANIAYGTGFGKVQVFVADGRVTEIKPEESDRINLEVIIKND